MIQKTHNKVRWLSEAVHRDNIKMRVSQLVITLVLLLLGILFLISLLYKRTGSFTATVARSDSVTHCLYIDDTPQFNTYKTYLNMGIIENITNISGSSLPLNLDKINSEHNGSNYLAYTFYTKNLGDEILTLKYQLYITNITKEIDSAIRVRLYINGEPTTYAKTATDGSGAEPDTVEFLTQYIIAQDFIYHVQPNDLTKYTIVVWIEGTDPDCLDDKIGGIFKIAMNIDVAAIEAQ